MALSKKARARKQTLSERVDRLEASNARLEELCAYLLKRLPEPSAEPPFFEVDTSKPQVSI